MFHPLASDSQLDLDGKCSVATGHAHLIGIAGSGMRALAMMLDGAGWQISGSDLGCATGLPKHWNVCQGHAVERLLPLPDLVVHSPAIEPDNVELAAARRLGVTVVSYPQMLGRLMRDRFGIAIAGTHGKSTTAAMVAHVLQTAGLDPTAVIGAESRRQVSSAVRSLLQSTSSESVSARKVPVALNRHGAGPHMIVEACEYRASFLHLRPKLAAILNIEPDHFDYFRSPEHLEHAFGRFAELVPDDGAVVVPFGCDVVRRAMHRTTAKLVTFGCDEAADWRARPMGHDRGRYRFVLTHQGQTFGPVTLPVPGQHNIHNATAAAAVAYEAGVDWNSIQQGLESFPGLRRRMELIGVASGVVFIDDYAHHPTEVAAALATVRRMYPGRKIWCVFEPHQASRTKSLLDELAASLQNADTLAVAEIFRAREPEWQPGEITAEDLAVRARQMGADVATPHSFPEIETWLFENWRRGAMGPGDVLVTLGAGQIESLAYGVYKRLREDHSNG